MPWGIAAAVAAPVIGGLVSDATAPSTSGGGPNYYTPTGLSAADQAWQSLLQQQLGTQGAISGLSPYYQAAFDQAQGLQGGYSPGYLNAGSAAGRGYSDLVNTLTNQAGLNYGTQQALLGAGQNIYNMALDPRNALYDRTRQQLQEQTGATNSMYGLGSSGAGAGVANQALSNFNIDWQNQQLQRALQGLQGYAGAAQTAGGYGQLATGQASAIPGYILQQGQTPYQTSQAVGQGAFQPAAQYAQYLQQGPLSSAAAIQGQTIPYMNYGAGAQAIPYQQQTQGAGALGSLVSQGIQGLGSSAQNQGWLSNIWGGGGSSPWGGQSNATTSPVTDFYSGVVGTAI